MICIEEIPVERIAEFWKLHFDYLVRDGIISDDEDKAYFQGDEYRSIIRDYMLRTPDRHHLIYFVEEDTRVGAASYCTFQSEDGKCFILDYWIFPPYRSHGCGQRCFEALMAYTARDGAKYYQINCVLRADRVRFWKRMGFVEDGIDEYGVPLFVRR